MLRFQSTFPRGERRFLRGGSRLVSYFNPRSLVGNDAIDIKFYVPKIDFNPRSLVGNDEQAEARQWQHAISIHVPSWGTTACTSIETGVDLFQSTFPRGERRQLRKILHKTKQISIHVPSWGTTQCLANTRRMRLFQSTFPRGERQFCFLLELAGDKFQSTFPRGERHSIHPPNRQDNNFNPRSLVGNDANPIEINVRISFISIHGPSWGTTANFHKYSLFFYAINIIFLLCIIPSLFSLVLFMLLF